MVLCIAFVCFHLSNCQMKLTDLNAVPKLQLKRFKIASASIWWQLEWCWGKFAHEWSAEFNLGVQWVIKSWWTCYGESGRSYVWLWSQFGDAFSGAMCQAQCRCHCRYDPMTDNRIHFEWHPIACFVAKVTLYPNKNQVRRSIKPLCSDLTKCMPFFYFIFWIKHAE